MSHPTPHDIRGVVRRGFRAMGSRVELTAIGLSEDEAATAAEVAARFAEEWENHFSRFRPASELSRLNAAAPAGTTVSSVFLDLLLASIDAFRRTGGLFDPSILPALSGLGYDRDFGDVARRDVVSTGKAPQVAGLMEEIEIDLRSRRVKLPSGCQLDFGGIAKGIFVDRLAERFAAWPGGCVSAGGDLRVWGESPDGEHWVVGIEDPFEPSAERCRIAIEASGAAAVATSAMNRRVWWTGSERLHHLIDPATGRPVLGQLASVTALAPDLATAEVATKAILVSGGRGEALRLADASGAVVVDATDRLAHIHGRQPHAYSIHPLSSSGLAA